MESGERIHAGQPEPRAASASRRRSHPPRPPRRLPPSPPSPRACPAGGQLAPLSVFAEPRGHRSARLRSIGPRTASPPSSSSSSFPSRAPGTGDRCLTREAQLHFSPRVSSCRSPPPPTSQTPSLHSRAPRLRSSRPAPATFRAVPKVGARRCRPHHGTGRLARPSLHPGRAQRRAPGCRAQVEKLLGSATSLRVKRLQQERCPDA